MTLCAAQIHMTHPHLDKGTLLDRVLRVLARIMTAVSGLFRQRLATPEAE
jgi:hypothetical protein